MAECPYCGALEGVRMKDRQSVRKWRYCRWCSNCYAFYDGRTWRAGRIKVMAKGKGG